MNLAMDSERDVDIGYISTERCTMFILKMGSIIWLK